MKSPQTPNGWAPAKLGDLVEFTYGKALPDKQRSGSGFPVFGSNGIVGKHAVALTAGPTIIIGRKGSVGQVHYSPTACSPIDTTYYIDSVPGSQFGFWRHRLRALGLESLNKSTAIPGLSRGDAYLLAIHVPPVCEQRRIADKLDTVLARVDAVNDRLARVAPLLKRFRQSVLAAAMSGKLTEEWRDSEKPSPWETATVGEVADVGTGSTPLRSNPDFFTAVGTPWVTSAATGQPVVNSANEYVTDVAIAAHRLKRYPVGTLLVAMYGEGKTRGQISELGIEATINQACAAIVVDEALMARSFVKLALQANYMEMRSMAEGGNQPNLNMSKVKGFSLPKPPAKEQTEIVRRVELLFSYADRLEARLQAAQTATNRLTPALLAKAFRGELVPQDPNDEPASELLKRLAAARETSPTPRRGRGRTATAGIG